VSRVDRQPPTADEIYTATTYIPADDRDDWIKIGMAIKAALGDVGYGIWDQWSQTSDKYDPRAVTSAWRSFKPGAIGIGTLFHYAHKYGYNAHSKPITAPRPKPGPPPVKVKDTAPYAARLWLRADWQTVPSHPYAIAKGITSSGGAARGIATGKKIGRKADCIIVPIRDIATDKLVGVQCIIGQIKQNFGTVSGNGLLLGNTLDKSVPWYVCEGWASAYSMVISSPARIWCLRL